MTVSDAGMCVADLVRETRTRLRALSKDVDGVDDAWAVESVPSESASPFRWLRERLGLTSTEERVLWVLLAHELDSSARQLVRDLNTEHLVDPTLDVLRRTVYGSSCQLRAFLELAIDAPLRRFGLIERTDGSGTAAEHRQTFAVARRVLALALGDVRLDPSLSDVAKVAADAPRIDDLEVAAAATSAVQTALAAEPSLVIVSGRVGTGRRSLLQAVALARGYQILLVDGRAIANTRDRAQQQLRAIARESRLLELIPLIQNLDALGPLAETPDRIDLVEDELSGLALATTGRLLARRWRMAPTVIELAPPTGNQRARLWARAIPEASAADTELMATMYPLAPGLIHSAGKLTHRQAAGGQVTPAHIEAGVRGVLDDRLAGLATRVEVSQSWEDLVLPDDQLTSIIELLARIRQRRTVYETWGFGDKVGKGLGVSALFSGPPGTGKTMAAGLVAKDVRLELYQVDLSKIVSKWIGETEKNLANLFDAAEACHAILLFDEADALFAKRTDVRSSNDRYANQEVNFLLQRMETFMGVCILTTNHETAIDEAFRRRLSTHVRFPVPDIEERRHLWRALMPQAAPVAPDLDVDSLAEAFVMSGGYIRNAVLRAAFLAADAAGSIDTQLLTRAAQLEYEAIGKVIARSPVH